eukprot:Skav208515  [mRNA]  locus=scaffold1322:126820:127056:- [translate_table: standard]
MTPSTPSELMAYHAALANTGGRSPGPRRPGRPSHAGPGAAAAAWPCCGSEPAWRPPPPAAALGVHQQLLGAMAAMRRS